MSVKAWWYLFISFFWFLFSLYIFYDLFIVIQYMININYKLLSMASLLFMFRIYSRLLYIFLFSDG